MAAKPELLRLALRAAAPSPTPESRSNAGAVVVLDPLARMSGRGAYVCRAQPGAGPAEECIKRACARGGLQRAFRRAVNVPVKLVESGSR